MHDQPEAVRAIISWLGTLFSHISEVLQSALTSLIATVNRQLAAYGLEASNTSIMLAIGVVTLLAAAILMRLLGSGAASRRTGAAKSLADTTRFPRRLGIMAAALFVMVLAGWSVFAPLASAALAPGVISPDGHRQTVQHLEGGIIRTIHVREGDVVKAGTPLVTLDDTRAKALDAELRERFLYLLASQARLEAEQTEADDIGFPQKLLLDSNEMKKVVDGQRQLFLSRRAAHQGRLQILDARIRQLQEQNVGLREMIKAEDEQTALIDEEMQGVQTLIDKGLERKPRLLALRRGSADIAATKASNHAKIAENEQQIGETRLQLVTVGEERQEKIGSELAEVRRVLAEVKGQLPSREDMLIRTVIRAPIDGTVMNVRINTETGVVAPGQPLLDIVPDGNHLVIDARVRPTDIERIKPGMSARVVLTAYRQRSLPLIHGRLRSISADSMADERTGQPYFLAKVDVAPEDLAALQQVTLMPGMPAEIMLMDGEQSVFAYLLGPVLDSARRSLREN
ncbi:MULTISPECIES: HlyD family type I secretion periplasmic adaptor subunit [unclassified Mesorhizobium]|uniref:HlyD family type I secretion periplasmic adaptor subunit n=1 Tax=unclassified Mesorhizobium TaxID=325217 RepID=UPI000FCA1B6A|nr:MULTISPECIES: HlyD family type I secretion periplasmic adaptor subunit [unclassified Mesorhizobium]RUW00455.1 HlyD family type I secretion periplasmic adaptor subunit [Mesorhizobium sp. M1A.F.Ca.IN.020.04.1.1]RUW03375.1 HlyD family type I secretion periplasmic adaptor subunit [Mesorhizobium sp. M1A.F.Ca.IN.020.03.1.1]RWF67097.1 MAG: HlyD family type I secretion periplasmic adaptor subunit [Mesorhizobium sp.]RWG10831.1 MAG: HlyD family type I secretion periplasmic adaptor subunit [Mesorhizobi